MWVLRIQSSAGESTQQTLNVGITRLGRSAENQIPLSDASASRVHAEFEVKEEGGVKQLFITDLHSTNGTFVNRERIFKTLRLQVGDVVRVGEHVLTVQFHDPTAPVKEKTIAGSRPLSREALLDSLDRNAVLMSQIAQQLNTIVDLNRALEQVSQLMKSYMGADKCELILAKDFDKISEHGFPTTIAQEVIQKRATVVVPEVPSNDPQFGKSAMLLRVRSAICVPILSAEQLLGLIYMYKTMPEARSFSEGDLSLAIAISHQAALTIQRAMLIDDLQREQQARNLLLRFLSPPEAEFLLRNYMHTGILPPLSETKLTVLFSDIVDSTRLAERVGAKRFGEMLTQYYQEMTAIVFEFGGMLDKYMGDGLMAVFGMNPTQPDPEIHAVLAGLAMLERLKVSQKELGVAFDVGIGINSGTVVAGYVGTAERVEFTVLGDSVNVAHRLETLARPNRLVVGPTTAAALAGRFATQRIGAVQLKGRSQPVQAHEVLTELKA